MEDKKGCTKCICSSCMNTMWDGGYDDCFTCEYCIDSDRAKEQCENYN